MDKVGFQYGARFFLNPQMNPYGCTALFEKRPGNFPQKSAMGVLKPGNEKFPGCRFKGSISAKISILPVDFKSGI